MLKTISSLLDPLTPSEFHSKFYSVKPLHINNTPNKFQELFSWSALNKVLNSSPVPHPTMKMVLRGSQVTSSDAKGIIEKCREGASLIIEEMHKYDSNVGELSAALSSEIGEPVRINMYLSQPSHQGYNRHYDTHDVFILQIAGFKGWKVFDDTLKFPLFVQKRHGSTPPETPRLECILQPGDVLYIPRGHWHEATAQIEPSLHLTVGIYARTGINFLNWLADELREDVRWRETFPLVYREDSVTSGPTISASKHFNKLKDLLVTKLEDPSLLNEYHKFCVAQESKPTAFDYPLQVTKSPNITEDSNFIRPSYQQVVIEKDSSTGGIEVVVWGKVLRFNGIAERLIKRIFSANNFNTRDLLKADSNLSLVDIVTVLSCLLMEGIIDLVDA